MKNKPVNKLELPLRKMRVGVLNGLLLSDMKPETVRRYVCDVQAKYRDQGQRWKVTTEHGEAGEPLAFVWRVS